MAASTARKQVREQNEDWLTLNQAADMLGIHRQTLLNRCAAREFETQRIANYTFVSRASVERALQGA